MLSATRTMAAGVTGAFLLTACGEGPIDLDARVAEICEHFEDGRLNSARAAASRLEDAAEQDVDALIDDACGELAVEAGQRPRASQRAADHEQRRPREEVRALQLCELMADQVAAGEAEGPFNSFLERNAGGVQPTTLFSAMRAECDGTIAAWKDMSYAAFEQRMEESLAGRENEDPWWEAFPQPLGGCFRDYNEAAYLSAQALTAATCIVDELVFGGTTPTDDAMRNLTGEIVFHATWASWDDATRRVQCQPIKARGFDAAEELGIAAARTWNDQLAGAGADKRFDDYAMVLDFLDVCERY
jgi:hypothetical protein